MVIWLFLKMYLNNYRYVTDEVSCCICCTDIQ